MLLAFLFVLIFKRRQALNDIDFENDHEDNGRNLNRYWHFKDVDYVNCIYFVYLMCV